MDVAFTIQEMRRAIAKSGLTAPGKDQISYVKTSRRSGRKQTTRFLQ